MRPADAAQPNATQCETQIQVSMAGGTTWARTTVRLVNLLTPEVFWWFPLSAFGLSRLVALALVAIATAAALFFGAPYPTPGVGDH